MFNSIIESTGLTLTSASICIVSSIILGLIISFIHTKGGKYSKNICITLAILPLLVGTIMIMVNGNLGTGVAIAGAFSLVRFRSMQGTSRDIINIFWAMVVGIAIGMGQVLFASIITIVVSLVLMIFYSTKFGENKFNNKILEILVPENLEYDTMFNEIFTRYTNNFELVKVKTTNLGSLYELKYEIELKKDLKERDLINELRVLNGNLKISIHKDMMEESL